MLPRRNVLVFHAGALGDFVLTWPVAAALGRLYPQSRIFYVTHGQKGKLAERALRIDSTDIEDGWHALFSPDAALPEAAEKLLASAHTVVTFLSDGQDAWAANARRVAPEAMLVHLQPPTISSPPVGEHASDFVARQLAPWPAVETAVRQILRSVAARGVGGRGTPGGTIAIHPGSGGASKCWPVENFVELAARLKAAGRGVRFLLGEVEVERWSAEMINRLSAVAPVETPATLVELWATINVASAFVGNDSGPAHLAGIAAVPTVVVYGPTSPDIWKPLGPQVRAVRGEPIEAVTVDEVFAAIEGAEGA